MRSGGLSCNIEKSETLCFFCFFFWFSFPEIFVLGLKERGSSGGGGGGWGLGVLLNFPSERLDRGTDSSDRDEWCRSESQKLCE